MNKAVIYSKQGDVDLSRDLLLKAIQAKVEKKHEKISESLNLLKVRRLLFHLWLQYFMKILKKVL